MALKVLVIGDSGTGKSASLRNLAEDEVLVINSANKPLPFKNHFECITPSFEKLASDVIKAMDSTKKKVIVIDDAQYILSFPMMKRIKESGWDKWNDIQGDFFTIIKHCDDLPDDVIVYFLSHLERKDDGHEKIKTVGKMLDEKITIEGLFTVVLKTSVNDGTYCFLTQNSGMDTVKSPIGMFPSYAIYNDLKYVDTKIRNYYEIGDYKSDEEVAQMDQEVKKDEISKPEAGGRKRRSKATLETPESKMDQLRMEKQKAIAEALEEPVKRRTRKERNGEKKEEKPEEAPAEEKKEETGRKRRRRKANDITEEDFMQIPDDISDDALPFN